MVPPGAPGLQPAPIVRSVRLPMTTPRRVGLGLALAAVTACERADEPRVPSVEPPPKVERQRADDAPDLAEGGPYDVEQHPQTPPGPPDDAPADPWVRGAVTPGDSLSEILAQVGLDAATAHAVLTAMTPQMDPAKITVGQTWAARLDDDGTLATFEFQRSKSQTVVIEPDDAGEFAARTVEADTEILVAEISGTIETSLWNAVTDAGEAGALVPLLVDVLASNIDFYTDTRKGDRFAVVIEKELLEGEHLRYARLLAVEYRGAVGKFVGVWWTPPNSKEGGYFDPEGNSLDRVFLKSPLKFTRVSSQFNPKRMHPVLHRVKGHFGTDYAAPEGTPVWAAADGRVVFRAAKGGAGNMVILSHDGGLKTLYMHLSRFEKGLKVGDRVRQKTVIGYVGQTGLATGPHLHFGLQKHGKYVDPEEIESVPRPGVPRSHRARFIRESRELFERLQQGTADERSAAATASAEESPSDAAPG
jgi:murein DD-endopeptidase MepM/ murein hydrolase activator NlpD